MPRVKKTKIPNVVNRANILIYDSENIQYFGGVYTYFDYEPITQRYDGPNGFTETFSLGATISARVPEFEINDNIMLDETTMKRIAVYNKQMECKRLDKEIAKKRAEIEALDEVLQDRKDRVGKLKEFICKIYDIDLDDYDEDDYWDED